MDMYDNVLQWCADWYDKGYYDNSPGRNPSGPEPGRYTDSRVQRGGRGGGGPLYIRNEADPRSKGDSIGFRCVVAAPAPPHH